MASKSLILSSLEDTERFAADLAQTLAPPQVIALFGDLGTGKTTFVRAFVGALQNGDKIRVKSPSFALHHEYPTTPEAHHLDLYRLTSAEQLEDLGLFEVIEGQHGFVLIEWPQIVDASLPLNTIRISFEDLGEDRRRVTIDESLA